MFVFAWVAGGCTEALAIPTPIATLPTAPPASPSQSQSAVNVQGNQQVNPNVGVTPRTELIVVDHKAAIHEAACSLSYQGEQSTVIRVAARGAAQAPGGAPT